MKKQFFYFHILALLCLKATSQISFNDSLKGFDLAKTVNEAHVMGLEGVELKVYVKREERKFIKNKYPAAFSNFNTPVSKFNKAQVASGTSPLCAGENFETSPAGVLTTTYSGWTASMVSPFNPLCPTSSFTYTPGSSYAIVATTTISDGACNNVANSPLGGSYIITLNKLNLTSGPSRISQTFSITNTSFIYQYAYKGVIFESHTCCDAAGLIFNFYDCSNNLLTALGTTVSLSSCSNNDAAYWVANSSNGVYSTPNWVVKNINLASYIGSCVTVEVIATACGFGTHYGYCYYDANCSDKFVTGNGTAIPGGSSVTASYTSCPGTSTLAGLAGFSSYLWQGPATSTVTGLTTSMVTTAVSGNYTLTVTSGTNTLVQVLALSVNAVAPIAITASSPSLCVNASSVNLQATTGSGITSYLWSNNATTSSISVSPTVTSVYSVVATNSLGCVTSDTKTVTVHPVPPLFLSASTPSLCAGQSATLYAGTTQSVSLLWSNSATTSSVVITPTGSAVYTVVATSSIGCTSTGTVGNAVYPVPQVLLTTASPTSCSGSPVVLATTATNTNIYFWRANSVLLTIYQPTITLSPTVTTNYSVQVTSVAGCTASAALTVTVFPLSQVQVGTSSSSVCYGQPVTLNSTVTGTGSYLWTTGANTSTTSDTPLVNTVYGLTVTNAFGCAAASTVSVTVLPLPQVNILATGGFCPGTPVSFTAIGAAISSYSWSTGGTQPILNVTPTTTTVYSLTVVGQNGCTGYASQTQMVWPPVPVSITPTTSVVCPGEKIVLTASATAPVTYSWSTGHALQTIQVIPSAASGYTVYATDNNGCITSAVKTFSMADCTGLEERLKEGGLAIYPNPTTDSFVIRGSHTIEVRLVNELGQLIRELQLTPQNSYSVQVSGLAKGIYYVTAGSNSYKVIVK